LVKLNQENGELKGVKSRKKKQWLGGEEGEVKGVWSF